MAGSDRLYLGSNQNKHQISSIRLQGVCDSPIISAGIRIGTAGTTDAVEVPPLSIVTKVGIWNDGTAISGATLSVGVEGTIDKFLGAVSTIAADDIKMSGLAGTVNADPVGGAYFASGGVIQLGVGAGTDDSTVKILVWFTGTS